MSFTPRSPHGGEPPPRPRDAVVVDDAADPVGRYLTDGVDLYRSLGAIPGGMGEMVGLENCRSLDVVLLPIGELHARRMRVVLPADGPPTRC